MYRYNSPLTYSLSAAGVPLTETQESIASTIGYASTPNGGDQTLFFGARGTEQFEDAHLFDLGINYEVPVWRTARPFVEVEVFNLFNDDSLTNFNNTINPNFDGPVDALGLPLEFTRGPRFGTATSETDFPRARTFQVSLGFRF